MTRGENVRRGGPYRRKEFCAKGHDLSIYRRRAGCRKCNSEYSNARYHRTKVLRGRAHIIPKTHCINGHEFTPENTAIRQGYRQCRICERAKVARYTARHA